MYCHCKKALQGLFGRNVGEKMSQEYWTYYNTIMTNEGETVRDRSIFRSKSALSSKMRNSPACKMVTIDGSNALLLVISSDTPKKKTIYAMPNESFDLGSIVLWNDSHWLITEVEKDDDILCSGSIEMCNREISWQNPQTGIIHSRWATVEKPYSSNIAEGDVITTSQREFKVQLPYDAESSLIDIDKRFMLETINGEPKTYCCTGIDSISKRFAYGNDVAGFLVLNLTQDQYNSEVDNAELNICDYVEVHQTEEDTPNTLNYFITHKGNAEIKIGGSAKRFSCICKNQAGEVVEFSEPLSWNIASTSDLIKSKCDGRDILISAPNTNSLLDTFITLSAKDENTVLATLLVKVVSLFG